MPQTTATIVNARLLRLALGYARNQGMWAQSTEIADNCDEDFNANAYEIPYTDDDEVTMKFSDGSLYRINIDKVE